MTCQIVIAGIGGQGVLFATRIFTEIAQARGVPVIGSENHGMAQRGGSVTSHLKLGAFQSPLVAEGEADLLLGLDALETHRNLGFLRPTGRGSPAFCVVNAPDGAAFPDPRVAGALAALGVRVHRCAADAAAQQMGSAVSSNLVLLGFASSLPGFPFPYDEVRRTVEAVSPPGYRPTNAEALERGRALAPPAPEGAGGPIG